MFPKKKAPGLDVMVAVGKPAKGGLDAPSPIGGKPPKPMARDEVEESAAQEPSEDYGAKLAADIEAAGESVGLDPVTSREAAGKFFAAAAKCLMGGGAAGDSPAEGAEPEQEYGQ